MPATLLSNDPRETSKAILARWGRKPEGDIESVIAAKVEDGRARAAIFAAEQDRLMPFLNTNTVNSDLKRTVIFQQGIRAFAVRVLALRAFCTVFNGVRLEGTNKVAVPYFPLITTASEDFVDANGYDTGHNTNSDAKTITVDKRKYQLLKWTSAELARLPFMNIGAATMLVVDQLGLDCVNDVLSIVTVANFPGLGKSTPAASFDSDDVADLKGVADAANWPAVGRSMVVNSTYDVNLLKDPSYKTAMAFGDNDPIVEGRIKRLSGFDYIPDGRVPNNSESLNGFICHKAAGLVAFAPVVPTPEVLSVLGSYEVIVEPTTDVQITYRSWGNPDLDQSKKIVEASYGKAAGESTALKRITN